MEKRGQTTAFIIIAIVIVVLGILIYLFYPRLSSVFGLDATPSSFMKTCLEKDIKSNVELLSKQGGYANPEGYILYNNNKVKYLCYRAQYYFPCYVQQPMIKEHFENELKNLVQDKAKECVNELKSYHEKRGYDVSGGSSVDVEVSIIPEKMKVVVTAPLTITKGTTQNFNKLTFEIPSKMYSLLMTATSIIDFESTYGDSETSLYMQYYPNLRIQKTKLGDGSTVYTLTDVTTQENFTFASRSIAWPAGYGLT